MSEKYVKEYFALSHLLVIQRLVLRFNKSTCFSKIIRNTEDKLQYAYSDDTFLTLSNLNAKLKQFYKHQCLGFSAMGHKF